MKEVYIVDAIRTPIGSFGGSFKNVSSVQLGEVAVKALIDRNNLNVNEIDEVYFGNILQGGNKQNIARQIAVNAGIPVEVPATAINILCGSGLKTVTLAAQSIWAGENDLIIAGGTESMSNAAYVDTSSRWGTKMGDFKLVDTMLNDALTDAFTGIHMGITAENIAAEKGYTREELDRFAVESQNKAQKAQEAGKFVDEITPVTIPQRKGDPIVVDKDEYIKYDAKVENLARLRPAFKKDGVITAGNASGINDGASALIIASKEKCEELGLKPMAKIISTATAGVKPEVMGYGPIPSTEKALKKAGLEIGDIELVEANEAFAAQAKSVVDGLGINPEIVNVNGGAIALGHPVGASGARILTTLLYEMKKRENKLGLATLCVGGGMGVSVIVEMI